MIYTSYFALIPKLPPDMLKVSVSLGTPQWAKVDGHLSYLNPTAPLLREAKSRTISLEAAREKYCHEILGRLSPIKVYEDLLKLKNDSGKNNLALLCYEKPGEVCHRRFIAQWLENGVLIRIPEYIPPDKQLMLI
jgi:uncharacterized protein YeaO (DUF488 family)